MNARGFRLSALRQFQIGGVSRLSLGGLRESPCCCSLPRHRKTPRSDLGVMLKGMRKEPYDVGSIVHVLKRGARGLHITGDEFDRVRFMKLLHYLNDEYVDDDWELNTRSMEEFCRPKAWPPKVPLVHVYAWVLMPNHFHLILKEIRSDGVSKFMQKLCGSMTMHFNLKYQEKGSIFQGPYKLRAVGTDRYFIYLAPYVMVKNVFELYPGGLINAAGDFEKAWKWANEEYRFSSLPEYTGRRQLPITHPDGPLMFDSPSQFKSSARDMIAGRAGEGVLHLALEEA